MKATVGRIVHFHQEGGPYPSIVTAVNADGTLELATFGKNSLYFQHGVREPDPAAPPGQFNTWSWPPRESSPTITLGPKGEPILATCPTACPHGVADPLKPH